MKKTKEILVLILAFAMIFLSANFTYAADKLTASTTANGVTVKWEYELEGENIVNLVCTNIAEISGKVEIPSEIEGKKVLKLGSNAFSFCYGMTEVTFPETLTTIENYAFEKCTGLKQLTLPDTINSIGASAFKDDSGLKSVTLSKKLTNISKNMFQGCNGLATIKLPENVTTIFGHGFYGCSGLKSIIIPKTVSTIEEDAFHGVENLTVYGEEGSYAEEWAKKKGYTFDVIENYNPNGTAEKVGPKVTSIEVVSPKEGTYKSPQTIQIAVYFSEKITGTTVPTLTIRFGTGTERKVTNGVIKNYYSYDGGKCIVYSYNIQNDDEGQLQTVSLTGGTIKDANENDAILSCPIISGNAIIANKAGILTNNTENQDKTNNDSNTGSSGTSSTGGSKSPSSGSSATSGKSDSTTSSKILPNTGKNIAIFGIIALVIVLGIVGASKYYKYKDIK